MSKPHDRERPDLDPELVEEGDGFHYVAGQILVNAADEDLVARPLDELRARRAETDSEMSRYVVLYELPDDAPPVPEVVARLRAIDAEREPRVGPNHVVAASATSFDAQPNYHGGPGGSPIPAPGPLSGRVSKADPVVVAVLDTGTDPAALQSPLLHNRFGSLFETDAVYIQGTDIALMGGHGTMVAGIVARHAPNATLLSVKVLSPAGLGSELDVVKGIGRALQAGATVLNLSLGAYVMPGQPPTGFDAALSNLPSQVSVVSAAGNYGLNKPYYPAAHLRVVGVAALDTTFWVVPPAGFSNFGPWVDAAAPGVRIYSTYVTGTWKHKQVTQTFTGHAAWSGTSFAAPHVAGVIADKVNGGTARDAEAAVLASGPDDPDYGVRVIPAGVMTY
jgi:subtilisin family serine protease